MASLLDSILASAQGGGGILGGYSPPPQSNQQSQQASQSWLDALMGATQGIPKDPYSSPSMLMQGPYGVQNPPAPAPTVAPASMSTGAVPFLNQPQPQMPAAAPPMPPPQNIPPPAAPPSGAMPASLPAAQSALQQAPMPPAAASTAAPAAPQSFMGGLNNYIDNNRAMLMALAGGIGQGGFGPGFSQAAQIAQSTAPKFGVIGHDILGQPQMGWINAQNQTVKPLGATPGATGIGGVDNSKPIYAQLPKAQQGIVDTMLNGKLAPPTAMALKSQYWNTLLAAADEKAKERGEPGFNATTWYQKKRAADDLSPQGKTGATIGALDTVQGHIGDKLIPAIDKLEKTGWAPDIPLVNSAQNMIAGVLPGQNVQRAQALTSFNNSRKAVVDEMGKAYKAGQLTDAEVRDWSALISNADSPIKLRQATADFVDLLNTKRQQLIGQYGGLGVEFKGANADANERITKLAHDKNMPAAPQQAPAQAPGQWQTLPNGVKIRQM